jgi:hypothetical protein
MCRTHSIRSWAASLLFAILVACANSTTSAGAGGGGGVPTLDITAPADGAQVSVPFTVTFSSSEQLGASDTGADHVHLCIDDTECSTGYDVVEAETFDVTSLADGEHTLTALLRHADHSDAGASPVTISIVVSGGTGGAVTTPTESERPGYGGYG